MKKFLAIFFSLFLFPISLITGCGGENDSKNAESMKYKRIIVVGIDDEFAPMGFKDESGEIVGFDVDLAKEAAKRMGVEGEFRPIDWNNKEFEITSGNIDMIWNGCDITEEYKEYMIFSKPYMDNRQVILVKSGNRQKIRSEYDFAGKKVGTQSGSNSEDYINANEKLKESFASFKTYLNVREAFNALNSGEVDALITDEVAGRYEMVRHPGTFEIIEVTVGPVTEFGIGFSKENTALRDRVQNVFNEMIKDGTAKKISEKWFQADVIK